MTRQYGAAIDDAVVCDLQDRGLVEVTGADRAKWFHNLITNIVATLQPGEGNYAFAVNLKGRVLFDLNVLVLDDRLWLDVDRRQVDAAMSHLERYIITEDVSLANVSDGHGRIAVLGPKAHEVVTGLALGNLTPMSQLQHVGVRIGDVDVRMIRHDFAGLPAAVFIVPTAGREAVRKALDSVRSDPLPVIDPATIEVLRIEAGIPASLEDIDEEVSPPETGQVERGISYQKGCYLGQEIIERMRSRGVLARRLVGIRVEGDDIPTKGAVVVSGADTIGRVTSACRSVALDAVLALGYVKSDHAGPSTTVGVEVGTAGRKIGVVVGLPIERCPS